MYHRQRLDGLTTQFKRRNECARPPLALPRPRRRCFLPRVWYKEGRPTATRVPTFAASTTPTRWSIGSPFFCRPPPSATTDSPTSRASISLTQPARSAVTSTCTGAFGNRPGSSTNAPSPPCATINSRNFANAAPESTTSRTRPRAISGFPTPDSRLPNKSISAAISSTSAAKSAGPSPFKVAIASCTSSACPTAQPSGLRHLRDQRRHAATGSRAHVDHQLRQRTAPRRASP